MRKPMKCKLCGKLDNPNCDVSAHQNTFSNKPSAQIYPIVNTWQSQYVFLCNNCVKQLNEPINSALYEPYEPIDGLEVKININDFTMRLNCNT